MQLANTLTRGDGSRGTWGNRGKAGDELHTAVIAQYETRVKELSLENKELRQSLVMLEGNLATVLPITAEGRSRQKEAGASTQPDDDVAASTGGAGAAAVPASPRAQFALPYAIAREGIEDSLRAKMEAVKNRFAEVRT